MFPVRSRKIIKNGEFSNSDAIAVPQKTAGQAPHSSRAAEPAAVQKRGGVGFWNRSRIPEKIGYPA